MIITLHGAWWETLFGTLPSRKRLAPVIPLLPTTIRSAPFSSATSRMASAGSPSRAGVSTSTPSSLIAPAASSSVDATSSRGLTIHWRSSGTCWRSSRSRPSGTGSYALTRWIVAPMRLASSVACRTASLAVSDPSVPTTMDSNIGGSYWPSGQTAVRVWSDGYTNQVPGRRRPSGGAARARLDVRRHAGPRACRPRGQRRGGRGRRPPAAPAGRDHGRPAAGHRRDLRHQAHRGGEPRREDRDVLRLWGQAAPLRRHRRRRARLRDEGLAAGGPAARDPNGGGRQAVRGPVAVSGPPYVAGRPRRPALGARARDPSAARGGPPHRGGGAAHRPLHRDGQVGHQARHPQARGGHAGARRGDRAAAGDHRVEARPWSCPASGSWSRS